MDPHDPPDARPPEAEEPRPVPTGVSRRGFVKGAATAAGLATVATFWFEGFGDPARRARIEPTPPGAPLRRLTRGQFRVVEAMVDRLLPSHGPDSPGARDVNTAGYIDAVLADEPIPQYLKDRVLRGLPKADPWAREHFGAAFADLDPARRDAVIRLYHGDPEDTRFLRLMVELTLECFFCDPVRGGNVREIGWKWAEHRPGSPRPTRPGWRPRETS